MSAWSITYNGFGTLGAAQHTWSCINVTRYEAEAVFAPDDVTVETTRHTMEFTAVITAATDVLFVQTLANAREQLARTSEALTIDAGAENVFTYSGDDYESYRVNVIHRITEISGARSAVIGVSMEWYDLQIATGESNAYHVMSSTWESKMRVDAVGMTEWTIDGTLRVRTDVSAGGASPTLGSNPDSYRCFTMPVFPEGFRYEDGTWVVDQAGERLTWTVVLKEYARNLPAPGRKGGGRFTWRRNIGSASGLLGEKTFTANLEGPPDASLRDMLAQLVIASSNRINYVPPNGDLVMAIGITELDIFNSNSLELTVHAIGPGKAEDAVQSDAAHNWDLLGDITTGTLPYEPPNAYGHSLIKTAQRSLFRPGVQYIDSDFPVPASDSDNCGLEAQVPNDTYGGIEPSLEPGSALVEEGGGEITEEHKRAPYLAVQVTERVIYQNPGTVVFPGRGINARDVAFQMYRPDVFISSEYRVARINESPPQISLKTPPGCVVVEQSWNVEPGPVDANNNRAIVGVYRRVLHLARRQSDDSLYWTIGSASEPTSNVQRAFVDFLPEGGLTISFPVDPRTQQITGQFAAETIFDGRFGAFDFATNRVPLMGSGSS